MKLTIYPIFIIFLLLASCTPEHCFEGTESVLKARFFDYVTKKELPPDSLTLFGLNTDSVIYDRMEKPQPALIPLNPSADSVAYLIRINGVSDTMTVFYTSFYHFVSKECGFTFYHNLVKDSVTTTYNGIDSIIVNQGTIRPGNEDNLKIFY